MKTRGFASSVPLIALASLCALVACGRSSDAPIGKPSVRLSESAATPSAFIQRSFVNAAYVTAPYKSAQTAGDLNVVVVGWFDSSASVTSVTDSAGNTYALAVGPVAIADSNDGGNRAQSIYYAKNIVHSAAHANTVTVNFDTPAELSDVRILEYGGLDPTSPLDVVAQQSGSGSSTTSGSVTTTHAADLLVAGNCVEERTTGPGTGFTRRLLTSDDNIVEDKTVSAVGSYSATAPQSPSGAWVMQMAAFKVATGGTAQYVQSNSMQWTSGTYTSPLSSSAVPYPAAQTAGDLNVVVVSWGDTTTNVSAVTDTAGNAYTLAVGPARVSDQDDGAGGSQSIYYAKNIAAAAANANIVTVTFSTATWYPDLRVVEYSALDPTSPLDVVSQQTGNGTALTSGAVTTTAANDLIVAAGEVEETITSAGSGFTSRIMTPLGEDLQDETVSSVGSYSATATQSPAGSWIMQVVAFKAAVVGCSGAPNGTACNDGNACTQSDTCQNGVCTGANPVTCTASDQCHTAGTCNTSTGACSNPVATNGTTCNDGNACTQSDTCQSGTCTGANPVTCSASDQCHSAGTCDTSTGTCSNPVATNGTTCNDGNACTQTDTCQSGTCTGANPVTCSASDQCHTAGTCDTSTGACSNPVAPLCQRA